ncbi:unnamed protein product [Strongylus vulgaris]|uniref:Uncharacterized protein n=1 Tax=Strongylus vulgaris TaxID=40348 RepID=A0A3P7LMN0_STRVU|nr:unnamed protein product [Strongylus vulgaris]
MSFELTPSSFSDDGLAIKLGQFGVDGINNILEQNNMSGNCSHLILHQVHSVSRYVLPEEQMRTTAIYDVTFQVSPSAGLFQVCDRFGLSPVDTEIQN